MAFALGWDPALAQIARSQMLASKKYVVAVSDVETPPAFSLDAWRLRNMYQGNAGTCWVHAGIGVAETFAGSNGYRPYEICRRLVGWQGKQYEGGGNPSNGGTVTSALRSMILHTEGGAGIAHEELCPYTDNASVLGQKPPQPVWTDAKDDYLIMPVDVTGDEEIINMIANKHPVGIGTWWPFNFDNGQTFMTTIGSGTYGHALTIVSYVRQGVWPGDYGRHSWFEWENWHGDLYPPLPPDMAALVPNYKSDSDKITRFWVRGDLQKSLRQKGNFECVSATDLSGLDKAYTYPSFKGIFPV